MDSNYLNRRAQELGLGREETLQKVQAWLDAQYPGRCRALSLNDGKLKLTTPDSVVASDLRMRQIEVLNHFAAEGVKTLAISIR